MIGWRIRLYSLFIFYLEAMIWHWIALLLTITIHYSPPLRWHIIKIWHRPNGYIAIQHNFIAYFMCCRSKRKKKQKKNDSLIPLCVLYRLQTQTKKTRRMNKKQNETKAAKKMFPNSFRAYKNENCMFYIFRPFLRECVTWVYLSLNIFLYGNKAPKQLRSNSTHIRYVYYTVLV